MRVTDSKSFGSAIRKRRKELGYTQRDLSEFSGLSISFLSDLERGKKTIELVLDYNPRKLDVPVRVTNQPLTKYQQVDITKWLLNETY